MRLRIRFSGDLNIETNDGFSPLHVAALSDQAAICDYLITKRNEHVRNRCSVPSARQHRGQISCRSRCLVATQVDKRTNQSQLTPLHCACAAGAVNVVAQLLELGADVTARDIAGLPDVHSSNSFGCFYCF